MKETETKQLIEGQAYYYDTLLDSYGEFIRYDGKDCVFKPIENSTYLEWDGLIRIESDGSGFFLKN